MATTNHTHSTTHNTANSNSDTANTNTPHIPATAQPHRMSDTYRMGVSYAKAAPNTVNFNHPGAAGPRPPAQAAAATAATAAPATSTTAAHSTAARLWKQRGGPHRRIDVLIEAHIGRLRFSYEKYPEHTEQASRQVLLVRRIEIRDRMACSQIKKFLYLSEEELLTGSGGGGHGDAAASRHMLVVKALHVRPEPKIRRRSEGLLLVSMLPPRLHIDQDAMLFLVEFFGCLGNGGTASQTAGAAYNPGTRAMMVQPGGQRRRRSSSSGGGGGGSASSSSCGSGGGLYHAPPVMMVDDLLPAEQQQQARRMLCENLDLLINEDATRYFDRTAQERAADEQEAAAAAAEEEAARARLADGGDEDDEAPIYWRTVVFSPAVKITLDYHGKRVEMSQGPLTGLIMGLGQLQCTEIVLKEINYR